MYHPNTKLKWIGPSTGFGVIATRFIPKGTVMWLPDSLDLVLTQNQVDQMNPEIRNRFRLHAYINNLGNWVLPWDHAKYVNHSCEANVMSSDHGFELCVRDIPEGAEITNDYSQFGLAQDEEFACSCGAKRCRTQIRSVEEEGHMDSCSHLIEETYPTILVVQQPLSFLFEQHPFLKTRLRPLSQQ